MAKVPIPPKPKLPKPKKSIGQHIKDNTRRAVSSNLKKNFGVLGVAISKKYLSSPKVKTNIKVESVSGDKNIAKKKMKDAAPPDASVLESAHQVVTAVETMAGNISRGFARTAKQTDTMGTEVSKSLGELANVLDRILYKSNATPTPAGPDNVKHVQSADDNGGSNVPSPRFKPKTKVRAKSKIPGFGKFGKWLGRGIAGVGTALEGYESYQEYQQNGNFGRAASGFGGAIGGMAAGAAIGSVIPGLGTFVGGIIGATAGSFLGREAGHGLYDKATSKSNKLTIGGDENIIHKMTYKAEKIKFTATNKIEFKSKVNTSASSSQGSGGSVNNMADKMIGGPGGGGFFNNLFDKMTGSGPSGGGGAGFFNGLADKMIGGRGGAAGSSPQATPSGTPAISKPDIEYNGPDKGQYDSTKAKANFMQPSEFGSPGSNLTTVKTAGGHSFQIHKESSEAFKRTIEDLENAGMPLGSVGGYSPRPGGIAGSGRMSQHSMGNAMDIGSQSARNVIRKDSREWIEAHPKEWRQILDKNGMISGGDWKDPDLGHIEWSGRKPWTENKTSEPSDASPAKQADLSGITIKPIDDTNSATKFGEISDEDNAKFTSAPGENGQNYGWGDMKGYMHPLSRPGSKIRGTNARIEDRRDTATTGALSDAPFKNKPPEPSQIGKDLGYEDILRNGQKNTTSDSRYLEMQNELDSWKEQLEPPAAARPNNTRINAPNQPDKRSDNQNQSFMQDTQKSVSSLDHRPRQEAVQQQDFGEYTGTTSGMEDVA